MKWLRKLLFPFNLIYFLVTYFRNLAFDKGWFQSRSYPFPVIAVGNLSVGGTGKTPMIEYLIRRLSPDFQVATLSRGYGRKTTGFKLADELDSATSIGDEPFQFYSKFKDGIHVAVDENRQRGIKCLTSENPNLELILLDDAFQHRKVKAGFYVLLTAYGQLYAEDLLLPAGDLREPKAGAKRAHVIVVTKCPENLSVEKKQSIIDKLKPLPNQEVFFSCISYSDSVVSSNGSKKLLSDFNEFTLVTGIANPKPFVDFLRLNNRHFEHFNYPDHHHFTDKDLKRLNAQDKILTTEKDFMRLKGFPEINDKLFYLPIETLLDRPEDFDNKMMAFINGF